MNKNFKNNNNTMCNLLNKEEEFNKFLRNLISSIIDFQARMEKKMFSLDECQRGHIRKISNDYFNSLLEISNLRNKDISLNGLIFDSNEIPSKKINNSSNERLISFLNI